MRVVVRDVDWKTLPPGLAMFEKPGQTFVTAGQELEVEAITVFEGQVSFCVLDGPLPTWHTTWLFDVIDHSIPDDWIVSAFHGEPALVVGPPFIASDLGAYGRLLNQESPAVEMLLRRAQARHAASQTSADD